MITSHVKNCYGYKINRAFRRKKKYYREMVWYFVGVVLRELINIF